MRDRVRYELAQSIEIIRDGHELVPRFRIEGPSRWLIFVQLPDDEKERTWRMNLISSFMAVKMANSFVMSTELVVPDAVCSVAVSRDGVCGALREIARTPLSFGEEQWLDRAQIGAEIPALLPAPVSSIDAKTIAEIEEMVRRSEALSAVLLKE